MSLIDDALKAAQRERAQRDSGAARPMAPVLVRLRAQPRPAVNRTYILGAAGVIGLVGVMSLLWFQSTREDALPAVPALTSAILSDALADTAAATRPIVQQAARPDSAPMTAATPAPRVDVPPVALASPRSPRRDRSADVRSAGPATGVPGSTEQEAKGPAVARVSRAGALDIAVETPRDAEAARLFSEAVAAHRAGALDVARPLYERVLALVPGDADALNNLGVILSGQREFDRALELLRRGAAAAPRNAGIWNNIGAALREQGKSEEAISAFRQALSIDPKHTGARVGLAQQYVASNAAALARDLLLEVLQLHPALPEAHYTLGQAHEQLGDRAAAIASYSAFIRVAPVRLVTHVELVRRRVDALSSAP